MYDSSDGNSLNSDRGGKMKKDKSLAQMKKDDLNDSN